MAEAGQDTATPAGLDARYEQLRHAVLHDRAHAFPLGLGLLIARGVTAWARQLTHLATVTGPVGPNPAHPSVPPAPAGAPRPNRLPPVAATQLVHALAGLAVALAGA